MPFAKSKLMEFPRDVIVGHGVVDDIHDLCDKVISGSHPLIVHDEVTKRIAGERVLKKMKEEDYTVKEITIEKATLEEVKKTETFAKKWGVDFLIAVGGGSVIDTAKLASFNYNVPFISVPTAASHDGIASPRASIKIEGHLTSKQARAPLAILADTSVIYRSPYRMLASGCADVISNLTAIKDWELAQRLKGEYYSSFATALAKAAAELLIDNAEYIKPDLEESAWLGVKSLIVSGVAMSVAGSSRPASGAEHMFSHTLDQISSGKSMHGEQCGIGAIMMMYLHGGEWEMIRDALEDIGAPTTARQLGIEKELIIEALMKAHTIRPERYTILGNEGLTKEASRHLVETTGVA